MAPAVAAPRQATANIVEPQRRLVCVALGDPRHLLGRRFRGGDDREYLEHGEKAWANYYAESAAIPSKDEIAARASPQDQMTASLPRI